MSSKTALVLITNTPLAAFGLDRVYMGCYRTGFIKFALFIFMILAVPLLGIEAAIISGLIFSLWATYDWLTVTINALSRSLDLPFCKKSKQWTGRKDIIFAFWLSIFLNLPQLILMIASILMVLFMGLEGFIDDVRQETGTEQYIPSGNKVKEFFTIKKK